MLDFYRNWSELFFLALIAVGMLISLSAPSLAIRYLIMTLSGMFAGRILYQRKNKVKFPYYMIIAGFVIGYLMGAYASYRGSKPLAIFLFLFFAAGAVISYRLYDKKILRDTLF